VPPHVGSYDQWQLSKEAAGGENGCSIRAGNYKLRHDPTHISWRRGWGFGGAAVV
jgi:hypothetical protein